MKMMKVFALLLVAGAALTLLSSCGSGNSNATTVNAAGQHPANWVTTGHPVAFTAQPSQCFECHDTQQPGGISRVSCVSCHVDLQPGQLPVIGQCVSCHAVPPNRTPNLDFGWHFFHAFDANGPQLGATCGACHLGFGNEAGVNDPFHGTRGFANAVVSFDPALAGVGATFDRATTRCDNIACHLPGGNHTWNNPTAPPSP